MKNVVDVGAAVVCVGGRLLLAKRRSPASCGGVWEFPGGKVERGETPEDCLRRELLEELGVAVQVKAKICEKHVCCSDKDLKILFYEVIIESGVPMALVHDQVGWFSCEEISLLSLLKADGEALEDIKCKFFAEKVIKNN